MTHQIENNGLKLLIEKMNEDVAAFRREFTAHHTAESRVQEQMLADIAVLKAKSGSVTSWVRLIVIALLSAALGYLTARH